MLHVDRCARGRGPRVGTLIDRRRRDRGRVARGNLRGRRGGISHHVHGAVSVGSRRRRGNKCERNDQHQRYEPDGETHGDAAPHEMRWYPYHRAMREATLSRGRLAEHPVWARALARTELAARAIAPVIVSSAVEDREKVDGASWLERLSLTEVVREARAAAAAGLAGLLLFGMSDRKDESAMLASQPEHVVPRAIRAVKEAVPDLAVATDVCVCAYTSHGQCVLFGDHGADIAATLEQLAGIAEVHADSGADLLIPSGMLEGAVRSLRAALGQRRSETPIAALVKLESSLYVTHRSAVNAIPIAERAVPLVPADDAAAAVARARRDIADGADAIIVKPCAPGLRRAPSSSGNAPAWGNLCA